MTHCRSGGTSRTSSRNRPAGTGSYALTIRSRASSRTASSTAWRTASRAVSEPSVPTTIEANTPWTLSDDLRQRDDHADHHEHDDQRLRDDPERRHHFFAWSCLLIAAIVRLIRALIPVVVDTSADCARRIRCGEPVANASFARRIARP